MMYNDVYKLKWPYIPILKVDENLQKFMILDTMYMYFVVAKL